MRPGVYQRGFTLIEILVVLIIVGLLASLTVINLTGGSRGRELHQQVQAVYVLMQTASEQAVLNNREFGLILEQGGYRFLVMDDDAGKWVTPSERLFRPRRLPEWVVVTTNTNHDLPRLASGNEDELQPDIVFFSSGETTPFEVTFTLADDSGSSHVVSSDGFSPMRWQQAVGEERS